MDKIFITKTLFANLLAFLLIFSSPAIAGDCSRYDQDKAEYFADIAGNRVIGRLGPAQDIITEIYSCSYNSYSSRFSLQVRINWNGSFIRSNRYWLSGVLTFDDDGRTSNFRETSASQSWIDLRSAIQVFRVAVELGALSNQ